MHRTTPSALCTLLCFAILAAPAVGADDWKDYPFYARARDEARLIPIQPLGERKIKVDGDLSDWGPVATDSFPLHELLDHTWPEFHATWTGVKRQVEFDAALLRLARDDEALYLSVKVADASVITPGEDRCGGDLVDLCFDVRPLAGKGPKLGGPTYTDGAYSLVFVPPSADGKAALSFQPKIASYTDWKPGGVAARIGPYQFASKLFKGGYTVELRLPLASLP